MTPDFGVRSRKTFWFRVSAIAAGFASARLAPSPSKSE